MGLEPAAKRYAFSMGRPEPIPEIGEMTGVAWLFLNCEFEMHKTKETTLKIEIFDEIKAEIGGMRGKTLFILLYYYLILQNCFGISSSHFPTSKG